MEYSLSIENTPDSIEGGSGLLLVHPSTAETDRIDIEFLQGNSDPILVVSTRTTAREVEQKLEHYDVDTDRAVILDTLSAERGYTRRQSDHVRYIPSPEDLNSIVGETRRFLKENDGNLRISVDSVTEMIYYANEDQAEIAVEQLLELLDSHDAVGLFHLAGGVHDDDVVETFAELFDGVIELDKDDNVTANF
jgi:KaiC/GvpD/RAD55 family RecA-like ATPase